MGRRPNGSGDARAAVLEASLRVFAVLGYDRATIREIARTAHVDPALVYHYFDGKSGLFEAAIEERVKPTPRSDIPAGETPEAMAERLVLTFFQRWGGNGRATPFAALLRAAMSDAAAAKLLRRAFERDIVSHVKKRLGPEDAALRVGLVASQLFGLATVRYVLRLKPVATLPIAEIARLSAPGVAHALRARQQERHG